MSGAAVHPYTFVGKIDCYRMQVRILGGPGIRQLRRWEGMETTLRVVSVKDPETGKVIMSYDEEETECRISGGAGESAP